MLCVYVCEVGLGGSCPSFWLEITTWMVVSLYFSVSEFVFSSKYIWMLHYTQNCRLETWTKVWIKPLCVLSFIFCLSFQVILIALVIGKILVIICAVCVLLSAHLSQCPFDGYPTRSGFNLDLRFDLNLSSVRLVLHTYWICEMPETMGRQYSSSLDLAWKPEGGWFKSNRGNSSECALCSSPSGHVCMYIFQACVCVCVCKLYNGVEETKFSPGRSIK